MKFRINFCVAILSTEIHYISQHALYTVLENVFIYHTWELSWKRQTPHKIRLNFSRSIWHCVPTAHDLNSSAACGTIFDANFITIHNNFKKNVAYKIVVLSCWKSYESSVLDFWDLRKFFSVYVFKIRSISLQMSCMWCWLPSNGLTSVTY